MKGRAQGGGFAVGLVAGLLIGLAVALGVALFVTKAPIPFINKVPQRTAEQDSAEAERNRNWDPNAPLAGKVAAPAASGVVTPGAAASAPAPAQAEGGTASGTAAGTREARVPADAAPAAASRPGTKDPAAILAGAGGPPADPFLYFVQTGAYTRSDDADQQKAKLALSGLTARVTEREQAGRTVYRVRLGPFPSRDEADALQARLQEQSVEAQIVRVEKP
jgi:cell division protein FtsN